ncbi:hypothetical protein H0E87_021642 [Populus deltoides]|uniref:Vesicle transport protein n=1 Tax=Populus deltoides TaxID=3696 RepID=A0A8T2XHI6_POPDE|nr:hypothetical protein H0E87_021642 [Populus deltoides]
MWKLNHFLSGDDEEREESFLEEESDGLCSLSPTQRMYAFAASLVAGLALMFLSLIVFAKPIKFALLFIFGNVLAVGSTAFLIGPGRQLGMMFDPARIYATAIYIGSLFRLSFVHSWQHLYNSFSEFDNRKFFWHFKCFVRSTYLPSLSCFRYSLSYIPFARRMVSNLMIRLCDTEL